MKWDECEKLLVMLAQRKGSTHSTWYGEEWEGLFGTSFQAHQKCLICNERFSSSPAPDSVYWKYKTKLDAKEHGMKHLKDSNLLPFA